MCWVEQGFLSVVALRVETQRHNLLACEQLLCCSQLKSVVISSAFSRHNRRHLCRCDIVHPLWFQNEIFASRHQDENSVACIEDRCYVLPLAQYCRWVHTHTHTHTQTETNLSDSRQLKAVLKGLELFLLINTSASEICGNLFFWLPYCTSVTLQLLMISREREAMNICLDIICKYVFQVQ